VAVRDLSFGCLGVGRTPRTGAFVDGRIFNVPEALQWGIDTRSDTAFDWMTAPRLSRCTFRTEPASHQPRPRVCAENIGVDPVSAAPLALEMRTAAFASDDFREGVAAFRDKRRPKYRRD
jgi:enoyl-CoA hydratase/carnithine racemase